MLNILCVSKNVKQIESMVFALSDNHDVNVVHASTAKFSLERVGFQEIDAVVVAEELADCSGKEFVERLTKLNPFVPCAMLSSMAHDEFHEETEGLGVLMQLPVKPMKKDVAMLLERLAQISRIMGTGERETDDN